MCRMQNIAMRDHQESVTTGQTPDKVIPMCHYALQATQKITRNELNIHGNLYSCISAEMMIKQDL